MIYNTIYETIGNTPVIRLNHISKNIASEIFLKLEWFNPGGSVKDRIALNMIEEAEKRGDLKPGDTIIEPTSGNTGIGLAMIAAAKGYKLIITMPTSVSTERRKILKGYGAKLILTDKEKGMVESISVAQSLANKHGYFLPMQFNNPDNPKSHEKTTAKEIINDFKQLDYFVAGVGTGGTITGCGTILKPYYETIKIIAVEPKTSAVLSGKTPGPHKIQGIGAGFIPQVVDKAVIDDIITVTDDEAFDMARRLAVYEGLFVGISTGANVAATLKLAKKLKEKKILLTVSPSNAERYLSTDLFNQKED